jgi:SAM-dependent methyltransferase
MTALIANVDQARAWSGPEGAHWAAHADRFDAVTAAHHRHLLATAAIAEGEVVLDIGCGSGQTTLDAAIAATPRGHVLGVDLSDPMLAVAAQRAHRRGLAHAEFAHADAQVHPFPWATYDVVLSRFGISFCGDPGAALANVALALRPGGRLAVVSWTALERNPWLTVVRDALARGRELPGPPPPGRGGPFGLGDARRTTDWLAAAGFADVELEELHAPCWFGVDADDAYAFLAGTTPVRGMTAGLDGPDRVASHAALHDVLAAHTTPRGVELGSSAWTITATKR